MTPPRRIKVDIVGAGPREVEVSRLVVAGFTARDTAANEAHAAELAAAGIATPEQLPLFVDLPVDLLTLASRLDVDSGWTSGEVEPVLVCDPGGWLVGIGSDHTDRELEREDIGRSKAACGKVMAPALLPLDVYEAQADQLRLRCWAGDGDGRQLYQDAPASTLQPAERVVEQLVQRLGLDTEDVDGTVVFLGTVPLRTSGFVYSDAYAAELVGEGDEVLLRCAYSVSPVTAGAGGG